MRDECKNKFTAEDLYEMNIFTKSQKFLHKLGLGYLMHGQDKALFSDNVARIVYSAAVGTVLEARAGRSQLEIAASRGTATVTNGLTGGIYSKWAEGCYKLTGTGENSSEARKSFADWVTLVSLEPYVFGAANLIGSGISSVFTGEQIDFESVQQGMTELVYLSPVIGPTMGWAMRAFSRYVFRCESVAERVT